MLTALIADWRAKFSDSELPFYIVELADFLSHDDVGGRRAWAEMRAEQAKAAEQNEHATLIKNSDLGEWNDIHPLDKKTLGNRVAEAAWNDIQVKNINKKKNK
jgi:sialate O-acetylesterase